MLRPRVVETPVGSTHPLSLGVVLELEALLKEYRATVAAGDGPSVARSLSKFLTTAGVAPTTATEAIEAFLLIIQGVWEAMQGLPPAFDPDPSAPKDRSPENWEYEGRDPYVWVNLIAAQYHWSLSDILALHPLDAARYIQEIELDRQFHKEWEWSRTEVAYSYDSNSKSSKFHKLPRPHWMQKRAVWDEPIKLPKTFIPVGNVLSAEEYIEQLKAGVIR